MTATVSFILLSIAPAAPALGPPRFQSVADLDAALQSGQPSRRLDAVQFLRDFGTDQPAQLDAGDRDRLTTRLAGLLADKAPDVRDGALEVLCAWQDSGVLTDTGRKAMAQALRPLVKDRTQPHRAGWARRLAKLDATAGPAAVDALRDVLARSGDEADRVEAADGLAELSPGDRPAFKALHRVMTDGKNAEARVHAARILVKIDPDAQPAATKACREVAMRAAGWPTLTAANTLRKWKDIDIAEWVRLVAAGMERAEDPIDRGNMASPFGALVPEYKAAVPALVRVMNGPGGYAKVKAADVVLTHDPSRQADVVQVARGLLTDTEHRGEAAQLLGRVGAGAKDCLPDLRAALKECPPRDGDDLRTSDRVRLLTAIGLVDATAAPEAVTGLRGILRRPNGWGRLLAAGALRHFGPAAREAVPELIQAGHDGTPGLLHAGVAQTLGQIGPAAREAEPLLREWAADGPPEVRAAAAAALEQIRAKPDRK